MFTVKNYDDYEEHIQEILEASISVRQNAYAPYSKFKVGAAVLTSSGNIYAGCNVENASYSLSTCAERCAIAKAASEGHQEFLSIAVCGVFENKDDFLTPCGGCRQNILEFATKGRDITIYLVKPTRDKVLETNISSLLPLSFKINT